MTRALLFVCLTTAVAQSDKLAFEEAAIKPVAPGEQCQQSMIGPMPGGGLRVECLPLKSIVTWAYEIQNYQITGGPAWMESLRWNILATAPHPTDSAVPFEYEQMTDAQRQNTMQTLRARARTLLADRFQLTLRRELREQTVYGLTIAKGGPKLAESADQAKSGFMRRGRGVIESRGAGLDLLAQYLGIDLQRPVINRTGLTAHYDFKLEFTPERTVSRDSPEPISASDSSGATLFTAIQEQLGLKLDSTKAPVEMFIVQGAEKPEN